jgi:DNA polymerase V
MFALVDGNNFFASCERVFRPVLGNTPLVVLSNNDGCVIARSPEAKALGIRMGEPWFEIREFARRHNVLACSNNPALYADMSNRMMNVLAQFSPRQEVYSIDECFLDLSGFESSHLFNHGQQIRQRVRQWLGLPVCVGIAPTKTLAKLANHCAKTDLAGVMGVCDFSQMSGQELDALFEKLPVGEIWGVGRKLRQHFESQGLRTVADLRRADSVALRKRHSVVVANMVHELNGISCLQCEDVIESKQQLISSRSFGSQVYALRELEEAVAAHIATAAVKLRAQGSWASVVHVHIRTSHHDAESFFQAGLGVPLREASNDTLRLTRAALWALRRIFRQGPAYHKVGIALLGLNDGPPAQADLFSRKRDDPRLMQVMDRVNATFGHGALRSAATAMSGKPRWQARREYPALGFTTRWSDLPCVSAR